MTAFPEIRLDGADDADNEVDFNAWTKIKLLYDAYVGQEPGANKIALYSSATALAFISFTAKAAAIAACANNAAVLAELGITTQGRNVLPNGDFRVAQRGAGPFTSATTPANNDVTYLLDGCILLSDGNDIVDVSQTRTVTPGGSIGGDAAIALDVETANKKFGIFIPVEARDAKRLIAGNATLSFQARRGANATVTTLRAAIVSWQGTEDSITRDIVSAWGASGTNPTLAANWTYETTPADLTLTTSFQKFDEGDGLAGAIDMASTKNVGVFIWYNNADGTVGDLVYITDIQLEKGLVATDFAAVVMPEALRNCQRYYWQSIAVAVDGHAGSATGMLAAAIHPVKMRTVPTITQTGSAVASSNVAATTFLDSGAGYSDESQTLFAVNSSGAGRAYLYRPVQFSAEL